MKPLNLIDRAFLLKRTRLFGSLDLDLLLTISDKLELAHFRQSEFIFHLNQEANQMYLIVEGKISIENAHHEQLALLKAGEFFGDESIFNEKNRAYNAKSTTASVLLSLSRNHLLGIIAECPSVALALLETYSAGIDFRKR
ncbi:MAG: cyclic nucleotide-binding domain-containing protein [Verrucomicrobia bacterium]|nr:cyclic nucleotide-binding domain-containing protein [Verrucomicrobiota bacterium]MBS0647069.1 cyclic nucleotide-binding domain-containing protein [Verrucomicrobiota bacterium]